MSDLLYYSLVTFLRLAALGTCGIGGFVAAMQQDRTVVIAACIYAALASSALVLTVARIIQELFA